MTAPDVFPLTADRWPDLVTLFTTSAVMRGCWCMWPRLSRERFQVGDANQTHLRSIVETGYVPGLLAYVEGVPAGWCSVGPLDNYARFSDGRIDGGPWVVACLFVGAAYRGLHVGLTLLNAAVDYAEAHGAGRIEGMPRGWRPDDNLSSMDAVARMFLGVGFTEHTDPRAGMRMWKTLVGRTQSA